MRVRICFLVLTPSAALAADPQLAERRTVPEVTSDTTAQFYDVRSPTGETILTRRRLTTTLGAAVYDLIPSTRPMGPELSFRTRLRYDADYGATAATVDPTDYSSFVPGFSRGPVDLMYGYVEGRRFLDGWLGFKLGRQYTVDSLGWWGFDGGSVKVTTPFFVAAELFGGLEVRSGMPLSTSRWDRDGVWRGDRTGYDPTLYPSFQPASIAPAIGASIETAGVSWLHGKLTYRRVVNTGASNVTQFASGLSAPVLYDGTRISSERVGYQANVNFAQWGGAKAGFNYDMYIKRMTSLYASLDAYAGQKVTLSLDYDYYQPSFDGDSIWNFFAGEPMNYFAARGNVDATDKWSFSATGYGRMFNVQTKAFNDRPSPNVIIGQVADPNYYPSNGTPFDGGGNLAARYKNGFGVMGLRGSGNFGEQGRRVGADAYIERTFETRFLLSGRASLWHWDDKLRPQRDAVSAGYVAGLGYRFAPRSQAMIEWEHNVNRLVGHRFRVMLWLTVAVTR